MRAVHVDGCRERGFSLFEVLVAMLLALLLFAGAANLVVVALGATRDAKEETVATLLALQKLEQLRAVEWASADLAPSPAGSLDADIAGYFDRVDAAGRLEGAASGSESGLYTRRWSVEPSAVGDPAGVVVRVLVGVVRRQASQRGQRAHAEVLLTLLRTPR